MRIAVYPGSFDPLTNGHLAVLKRALASFDEVHFLLAVNKKKVSVFSTEERLSMMKEAVAGLDHVIVDYWPGLVVQYCQKVGAKHIIRGLRAVTDFEYEFQLAAAYRYADPTIDMVFFMAGKDESFISSSAVNELAASGVDVSSLVPPCVATALSAKHKQ